MSGVFNDSIRYHDSELYCDAAAVRAIAAEVGTPVYIYSLRRALDNYERIRAAFAALNPHIHYSAKANANLTLLRALVAAGAGIDTVSGGEIYRALRAGAHPPDIVFAGVGKTADELRYAVEQGVGWFNVENEGELHLLDQIAGALGKTARIALRLNPGVQAQTHRFIATGHGGAKFGLTADAITAILSRPADWPHLRFAGLHIHIGSQLHDTSATQQAVQAALRVIEPYRQVRTLNIGGGLPAPYHPDEPLPSLTDFAAALAPLLRDYDVILEPGRSIIADAGLFVMRVLYTKQQGGQHFVIADGGMNDLIRPMLYDAHHEIVPVCARDDAASERYQVVGPVCETTDVFARDVPLGSVGPGDLLAVLTAGAYGAVMASNYNARPRPPEVVVAPDGRTWSVARRRETWADLDALEM